MVKRRSNMMVNYVIYYCTMWILTQKYIVTDVSHAKNNAHTCSFYIQRVNLNVDDVIILTRGYTFIVSWLYLFLLKQET